MPRKTCTLSFRIAPTERTAFFKAAKKAGADPSEILRALVAGFSAGNVTVSQPTAMENHHVS